jgi:hypothetical protein
MKGNAMKIRLFFLIALALSAAACSVPHDDTLFGSQNQPGVHGVATAIDKA